MRRTNPFAVASLVCALLCLTSPLAVVFGHVARRQIRRGDQRGYLLATVGLVLGYALVLFLALGLLYGGDVTIHPEH